MLENKNYFQKKSLQTSKVLIVFLLLNFINLFNFSTEAKAQTPEKQFNPSNIVSDYQMLNYSSMSLKEIQEFLEKHNSFLATYTCEDAYGEERTAAEIIYNATNKNFDCSGIELSTNPTWAERNLKCLPITTINPQAVLVLLQKEMSLIQDKNPSQRQLDFATGYGCPDGTSCSLRWKGFGKQVNSAALQFKYYMDNPGQYNYQIGKTYEFNNPYSSKNEINIVTIENKATAALYNYTPHVYYGNYNFFRLWQLYFGPKYQPYPNGSLLQARGEIGVWLIENGKKRPFHSGTALKSRFDTSKIIQIEKDILSAYETGVPIKIPNYSIVRSPNGDLYLIVDENKRLFTSSDVFKKIGFNPEEIINASWQDINSYNLGRPITTDSMYPTGALLQNRNNGGVYWVYAGIKQPLIDPVFLTTKFKNNQIIPATPEELAEFETGDPVKFGNGELLKANNSPAVFLIVDNEKRAFISGEVFEKLGYNWSNIIVVPERIIQLYKTGAPIIK